MRVKGAILGVILITTAVVVTANQMRAAETADVAQVQATTSRIDWQPIAASERMHLVVSGPDGAIHERAFDSGARPYFLPVDASGKQLADGNYVWELRATPALSRDTKDRLARARREGNEDAVLGELRRAGKLPNEDALVQSGAFAVQNGSFIVAGDVEPTAGAAKAKAARPAETNSVARPGPVPNDQVIPDDLIVQGSGCFGFDCVNNESFGFDTIRLKENNLRIKFEDTSSSAGFPTTDWQLTANDSASGGANKFSIEDITSAKVPFTITGGASTNSIFADSTGRIGFRTSTPVLDLHVSTSNTPALRLEQTAAGGFTAQTWDVAGNEANFFVRDVTGGSRLPFRIRPGAPTSSIDISADGKVGMGTASPQANLHVSGSATDDVFFGLGPFPGSGPALNIGYAGTSFGRGGTFVNARPDASATAPNPSFRIMTKNVQRIIVDDEGFIGIGTDVSALNPTAPIEHTSGAKLTIGGTWMNSSSRAKKQDIEELTSEEAADALRELNPVKYAYKADPNERHVGFIAEDVPALVASPDRKGLSPMDVVAVLTKVVQEQQRTIEELAAKVTELQKARSN